jgi:hypothetical protein
MRKIYLFFIVFISISTVAQNKQILYNFTSVPQSLLTNPAADVNYKWYFGIPLLSAISVNVGSSGFSAYDFFANNGVDFNTKLRDVVFSTTRKDRLALNEQIELFNAGFKIKGWESSSYVSFGMYQEFDFLAYTPKDLILLALDGNRDNLGKVFDLSDLSAKSEMLSVFHIGFNKKVNEKLILGLRGKIYSSIFNASSTQNSGYIYTVPSTNSFYEQKIYSNIQLNTSGISNNTEDDSGNEMSDIVNKTFFGGNLGLGIDAGLTYYPQKNIQFTASLIDLGFVRHSKEVANYTFKGTYKYEGINPNFNSGTTTSDALNDFRNAIPSETIHAKYTTWRPAKFNSSIQYSFDDSDNADCNCDGTDTDYRNAIGAQLFVMSTPRTPLVAMTAYYKRNVFENLQIKATYTADSYSYKNIGFGLSSNLGKLNFYVLADNLLEYQDMSKANSISFQFGFNIAIKDSEDDN